MLRTSLLHRPHMMSCGKRSNSNCAAGSSCVTGTKRASDNGKASAYRLLASQPVFRARAEQHAAASTRGRKSHSMLRGSTRCFVGPWRQSTTVACEHA